MASPGGIGFRDFQSDDLLNSTEKEWGMLNAAHYNVSYAVWQPDNYVGEANFLAMLKSRNIQLRTEEAIVVRGGVVMEGTRITQIVTQPASGGTNTWSVR